MDLLSLTAKPSVVETEGFVVCVTPREKPSITPAGWYGPGLRDRLESLSYTTGGTLLAVLATRRIDSR